MDYKSALGINPQTGANEVGGETLFEYVNMRLSAAGLPVFGKEDDYPIVELAKPLLENYREFSKLSAEYYCPPDSRIMNYLENYLSDVCDPREPFPSLPHKTFVLDRFGTARTLSLPPDSDKHENPLVSSYRVRQGILNNPRSDRRTTAGVFHVAEGGLPVPADKKSVPKRVFKNLWARAFSAPDEMLELPFTSTQERKAKTWVSIYLRPTVCPKIPNGESEKTMEIRFFAPGALVCNLDFVESIFGNAGNPFLQKNDAAEYLDSWTGHTGCIVLAPHLTSLKKKELGLPNISEATERQKRDGMCWEDPDELYNDGKSFKITARGSEGVIVTLIADNYFGYSKKEIKTQISYSANLYGQCEEEHSDGALAFSSRDLGEDFYSTSYAPNNKSSFARLVEILADTIEVHPDGWARDKNYPDIIYVDEKAYYSLKTQTVTWQKDGVEKSIRLTPYTTYISPAGYKVEMSRPHESRRWRLVGTTEEGVYCHKPATVSGGGKSEISKDISDAIIHGPSMIADFKRDIEFVSEIINKNYGNRYRDPNSPNNKGPLSRPILDSRRTMGSVVKLLTPSDEYSDEYNKWLSSIPFYIREFVLTVKRHYRPEWGKNWQDKFSVDTINGTGGNTLKYKNAPVLTSYLRIGFTEDGSWRTFSLRKDFAPSIKLQMEDDITTSVVVPESAVEYLPENLVREIHSSVAHQSRPVVFCAISVDFERRISRVDEHKLWKHPEPVLQDFHILPSLKFRAIYQPAGGVAGPTADDGVEVVHLDVHRKKPEPYAVFVFVRRRKYRTLCADGGFRFPVVAHSVARRRNVQGKILLQISPRKCETLLVEVFQVLQVAAFARFLCAKVHFGEFAPRHRRQRIPVEPRLCSRCVRILRNELRGGIEQLSVGVGIGNFVLAEFADKTDGGTDFSKVNLTTAIAVVPIPFDVRPLVRLVFSALRAFELPFTHVGRFELPVGIVVFHSALREENALAEPSESRNACLRLLHVSVRPLPGFVAYEPTNRAALEIAFGVGSENPKGHSVRKENRLGFLLVPVCGKELFHGVALRKEFVQPSLRLVFCVGVCLRKPQTRAWEVRDNVAKAQFRTDRLARLDGGYNRNEAYVGISHRLHRFAHPRGIRRLEMPRNRGVGNVFYVLLAPFPRGNPFWKPPIRGQQRCQRIFAHFTSLLKIHSATFTVIALPQAL